jgi:myo-inositol-1(or 4)-monophosphatase
LAALVAGHRLKGSFYTVFPTYVQGDKSEFTPFDARAEKISSGVIKRYVPSASIMGEDISPNVDVKGKNFWAIDGIDGTTNFARRIPDCNHTLAYVEDGETQVGVVCDFLHGDLYHAVRGGGAYLNGRPIHVKERPFNESVITFAPLLDVRKGKGATEGKEVEALWRGMEQISKESHRFHREFQSGGLELAWVASGKLDGYASSWTNPWDLSAGALLVQEAGGVSTNIFGEPWKPGYYGVIAGSQTVHSEMLRILKSLRMSLDEGTK